MPIAKKKSFGTVVKCGLAASPSTVLGQLESIQYSPGLRTALDTTCHDNTTAKSYIDSGLKDTPDADMVILLDTTDARHAEIIAAQNAGTTYYVTLVLTAGTPSTVAMSGIVLDASIPTLTTSGLLKMNIKYKAIAVEVFTA